jgi:uncharacterized protein YeaO (DUF488 family)
MIQLKRAYDAIEKNDGRRFLVDHLWPRGVKKEALQLERWVKDAAPSDKLRKWFGHDPRKWNEFRRRYAAELDQKPEAREPLLHAARNGDITLVFSARDTEHNNAIVLKEYLDKKMTGAAAAGDWPLPDRTIANYNRTKQKPLPCRTTPIS